MQLAGTDEKVLDAAERCISRFGLRRFSMGDVATQAGVSRGSVYRYFPDRDALVDAVLERVAEQFVASSEPVIRRRRTLATQVAEAAVFIREHMRDELLTLDLPAEEDSLMAALLSARINQLVDHWIEFWQPFLAEAEARGEVRPDLDHRQAGEWIVRLMLSFAVMPSAVVDLDDPRAVRTFVTDHIVSGLAA